MLEMGRQIAEALAHTHERGVLHLDLKPSNVLLTADGRPLLLDFNLSVDGSIGASVIGGTLPYMSPEQLQEAVLGRSYSSRPVDGRSDVFSLGVMLYELLAGRHPFGEIPRTRDPREAAKELLRRHERGPAPWPAGKHIDREVLRFLDACLAYHPDQRPQSAGEAAAALRRFLGTNFQVRRWARRRRKTVAAAGVVTIAVILSAAAATALAPPESERRLRAGETHLQQQELKLAEAAFKESLAADEQSPRAWELLGQVQFQQAKYRDAFASFHRAYALSHDPRFLENLGDCERAENQHSLAVGWYRRAIAERSKSAELHRKLGDSLAAMSFFKSAQESLDEAVELSPTELAIRRTRMRAAINNSLVSKAPLEESALEDARVIRHAANSTDQDLFFAAMAFACAESPERFEVEIRACLESAADKEGFNADRLRGGMQFKPFADRSWYQALLRR
jgi:tetratricopeptide (TPR) repeat protein